MAPFSNPAPKFPDPKFDVTPEISMLELDDPVVSALWIRTPLRRNITLATSFIVPKACRNTRAKSSSLDTVPSVFDKAALIVASSMVTV
ncbi:hypothetical protein D3C80_1210400 [compost metagenome]